MAGDGTSTQEKERLVLHERITETLDHFGSKDAFGKEDYWLLDENWGKRKQEVEVQNLSLLQPHVIKTLQTLLTRYPNWSITVSVAVPGTEDTWPGMGLIILHDEIVDELQRQYLPEEFGKIRYGDNKQSKEERERQDRAHPITRTARIPPRRSAVAPKNFVQRAAAQCRRFPFPA